MKDEYKIMNDELGTATIDLAVLLELKEKSTLLDTVICVLADGRISEYDIPAILRAMLGMSDKSDAEEKTEGKE